MLASASLVHDLKRLVYLCMGMGLCMADSHHVHCDHMMEQHAISGAVTIKSHQAQKHIYSYMFRII